ncbi:DUF1593 domain-containing protein [Candidatus Sumerlaeota bacterium]|nr:DUF1593 domain-containing protein [Candidatus Sumerlaeota bacterium]
MTDDRAKPNSSESPKGGALDGERHRVLVLSDIGGRDEDDAQSLVHYLLYADLFDTEGFVSSPPGAGRAKDFLDAIDVYEKDYAKLAGHSPRYPTPDSLRAVVKQGAGAPSPRQGVDHPTEGSKWIVECARRDDPRPLWVLVWGAMTDLAQALHDAPDIAPRIRVHFIAGTNEESDQTAFDYVRFEFRDLWLIYDKTTFRGWYIGGDQEGDLENGAFVETHAKGHGALGDRFASLRHGRIKMADTPTVAYLLRGDPDDPESESWGGRFVRDSDRPAWWKDDPSPSFAEMSTDGVRFRGARTINMWRRDYLRDFERRLDRCI